MTHPFDTIGDDERAAIVADTKSAFVAAMAGVAPSTGEAQMMALLMAFMAVSEAEGAADLSVAQVVEATLAGIHALAIKAEDAMNHAIPFSDLGVNFADPRFDAPPAHAAWTPGAI